jgi:N,N'-diacetyllegionaminate synthase
VKTLIIAEAGVNHNGDIELAKKLIDIAADAGADLVKFQTFRADRLVTHLAPKANYQLRDTNDDESQFQMLQKLELTESMHRVLVAYCSEKKIGFLSTGFDIESVNFLFELGQRLFKIPSGEITNFPYLQHIGKLKGRVILSTGMSNMEEIEAAINVLEDSGTMRAQITVLQCTTAYPVPMADVNLRAMQSIRERFKVDVGYSDHTLGIEVPIAAVALGAKVVEKHFTLNRTLPGPDHKASLEPSELNSMIRCIRNVEEALGNGVKRLMPSEISNIGVARKSIVASQVIMSGNVFTEKNLTTKRPGTGISPMEMTKFLGKTANRDYVPDEFIDES